MEVSYLPDASAHRLWPQIRALLKPAADYGSVNVDDPEQLVWIAYENGTVFAAATTLLWADGEAELRLAGGCRHKEWCGELSNIVSEWARNAGARKLVGRGRKGWGRYARLFGWVVTGTEGEDTLYEKDLTDGA